MVTAESICPWCDGDRKHGADMTFEDCPERDLLSEASVTGRIHAQRGGRCAADTCERLFGARAAKAYEAGYRREIARREVAA